MQTEPTFTPTGRESIERWRSEILERVFGYMFWLLAAILLLESLGSLGTGDWHALPALAIGTLLQGAAAFARRVSLRARAGIFVAAPVFGLATSCNCWGCCRPPWLTTSTTC